MESWKKLLLMNITAILAIMAASILAYKGVDGWPWFLVVAIIFGHVFGSAGRKEKDDE
ncbi:MAG: hypothetical protein ACRCUK_13780 [Plesiomonas shigelloides]